MKYLIGFLFIIVIVGCAEKSQLIMSEKNDDINLTFDVKEKSTIEIYDLITFPQISESYLKNTNFNNLNISQSNYEKNYFRVWNKIPVDSVNDAMWAFNSYKAGDTYGANLHLLKESFFINMKENSNFDAYKSVNKNALTLKHLDIRAFPTKKPLFRDFSLAGEGFPFDYMQNSTVSANKPVFISHYSKDKEWTYIFTSFTGGWVKSDKLVIIEKKHTSLWQKAEQIFLIKDNVAIYDENNLFLFNSRVGMTLALIGEDKENYIVLSVSSYKNTQPNFHKSKISKKISHKGNMNFNKDNLKSVMDEVAKTNYGWGGMYSQRDCSSMLRDLFTPFGVWLPRNSYQQSKIGKVIVFDGMNDEEKIKLIKEKAVPFETLLYKKGHIVLYVGTYNDEITIFHSAWGIKTNKDGVEGRIIVGKPIYSSLKLGKNQKYYDEEAEILKNLKSMNIITR